LQDIEFLYLTQADVRATGVDMPMVLAAVEDTFRLHHEGKIIMPPKVVLDMDERQRGRGNGMPAYLGADYDVFGMKWISGFPKNPVRFGLPRGIGILILNDPQSGAPLAIMDCTLISALRTGAVTGVGARYLARRDSETVAMIGAGVQARTQLEALAAVLPGIKDVRVYDLRHEAAVTYAAEMSKQLNLKVRAVETAEAAVRGADVVVTVTVADEPIVKDAWMKPGSFFSAVGSYQEEETAVVQNSDRIIVDDTEAVLHRRTPIVAMMVEQDVLKREAIEEIGGIIAGEKPGRRTARERIFFSPIGLGSEDIAVGVKAYRRALQKGLGTKLSLFG
jgi:N-[(2S)-2-amino-2-carboxyethyl]-L-glutamate dehydrogenase